MTNPQPPRRRFLLVIEPLPHIDPVRALRAALKRLRRNHGLRCVSISDKGEGLGPTPHRVAPSIASESRRGGGMGPVPVRAVHLIWLAYKLILCFYPCRVCSHGWVVG